MVSLTDGDGTEAIATPLPKGPFPWTLRFFEIFCLLSKKKVEGC